MGSTVLRRRPDGPEEWEGRGTIAGFPYVFRVRREVNAERDVVVVSVYVEPRKSAPGGSA
jgi:hypothetical protein